jgi:heme/copper-type cytochrome/quinol oxidase subunit 2
VRSRSPIRRRFHFTGPYALLAALVLLPLQAHAALLFAPDCSASGNSLDCRLNGVLSFLTIAAVLLAVVLVLVIVLAVRSYRRKDENNKGHR